MKNKVIGRLCLAVILATFPATSFCQFNMPMVRVLVAPDHADWTYRLNETATFSVQVLKYGNLVDNVTIGYEAGPEMFAVTREEGIILREGRTELKGTMKEPGFYRIRVWARVEGRTYEGIATAGFEPEKIRPTVKEPAGFDDFWNDAIAEARKLPLDPIMTLVPDRCTGDVNVYHISYQNNSPGSRIYGMLAVPKAPGKYPAVLKVPGAGIRPYRGDVRLASRGLITLEIGIHGIPVDLDVWVYMNLSAGALAGYWNIGKNDRDRHYYKRVYTGCVKAVDFIYSLPEFNGDVAVSGGSQGGALAIVTAGLDPRIKYLSSQYPALCDHSGYLHKRAGGWPHYFRDAEPGPGEEETLPYFDVVNFARRITAPGFYTWGYNDTTCPPTTTFAAYNMITAPKTLSVYQETGHWNFMEQSEELTEWLTNQLKVVNPK